MGKKFWPILKFSQPHQTTLDLWVLFHWDQLDRDQKFVRTGVCWALWANWVLHRGESSGTISYKGCGLGIRWVRVKLLGYFAVRQIHSQTTLPWEGKGMPIPLLQGCRHATNGKTQQNSTARSKSLPARCISTGGRKRHSEQGLSKCESVGGYHLGTRQRA